MKKRKGFTLMEMLIVVAIIAILISIAIPTFSNVLEKSRETKDAANIRTAMIELAQAAIFGDTSVAKGITYNKSNGYYQKIVYCTQKKAKWQSGDADGYIYINGTKITASSYSKVPEYWYVRYFTSGANEGTFAANVKSNKPK